MELDDQRGVYLKHVEGDQRDRCVEKGETSALGSGGRKSGGLLMFAARIFAAWRISTCFSLITSLCGGAFV